MTEDRAVLEVQNMRVEAAESGADIVHDVSFSVREGEVLGVVGESGCGKTTTGLALLGHAREGTKLAGGSVLLEGVDLLKVGASALRRVRGAGISYVAQDPTASLSPRQRVGNQVMESMTVHGRPRAVARPIVRELFERVGLPTDRRFLRRYPFELSGGQQQRVAIAMALACRPRVVVLDEPTTSLDVTTQARVLDLIRDLRDDTRIAFVYVTHDLAVVNTLADRILVMYAGRVIESGTQRDVLRNPAHPYTSLLLSSVPRLAVRRSLLGIPGAAPPPGRRPPGCFFEPRCPLAVDRCRTEFPPATSVSLNHSVRCWRASELAVQHVQESQSTSVGIDDGGPGPLLEVAEIVAAYKALKQPVLHGVSLSVGTGECVALVGESGSGKTTLGRCIAGLHQAISGEIFLHGQPMARSVTERKQSQRREIQIVFQNPERSLNPTRTVEYLVGRPLKNFGTDGQVARRKKIIEALDRVRLSSRYLDRYPRELSGGEKQRVAIARALIAQPSLLISDEITSSLDVSIQAVIVSLLEELRTDGLAILFITHNLALVNTIADRVLVLQGGAMRETGTTARVISEPAHDYTRDLLSSAPDLEVNI